MSDAGGEEVEEFRMSIMDHIAELRKRLIVVLIVTGVAIIGCAMVSQHIFDFLVDPMKDALLARPLQEENLSAEEIDALKQSFNSLVITDPMEGLITYLKVAVLAGLLLSSPVVFYQLWAFVAPGLYKREKRVVIPLMLGSTTLFTAGVAFGYFVIFEYGFPFFLSVLDAETGAATSLNSYLNTATKLLTAFGASFQLPVLVFFLARIGLIDHRDMVKFFKYAIVGIFVISALITPPDPMTQALMAGPLILLYTMSIGIAWAVTTKVRDPDEEDETVDA